MNLPNKLTMLRILLIPVFIVFATTYTVPGSDLIACAVFAVASFTDYLDGAIARKRDLVTDFGKFADPLADKLLTTTAFLYMMVRGACDPLVIVIILAREFAVSGLRMVAAGAPGGRVIAANMWGKVKTVLQMFTIIVYYFLSGLQQLVPGIFGGDAMMLGYLPLLVGYVLCWLVAVVTAVSGAQYLWGNRQFINTAK